jgi:hypothetical protein
VLRVLKIRVGTVYMPGMLRGRVMSYPKNQSIRGTSANLNNHKK